MTANSAKDPVWVSSAPWTGMGEGYGGPQTWSDQLRVARIAWQLGRERRGRAVAKADRFRARLGRSTRAVAKIVLPVVFITGAVLTFAELRASKPPVQMRPATETAVPVRTIQAEPVTARPQLSLYGETRPGRRVELRALVAGKVVSVAGTMREGGFVQKGAVLLEVDPFQYEGAVTEAEQRLAEAKGRLAELEVSLAGEKDNIKFTETQLQFSDRDVERAQQLVKRNTVSEKAVEDRKLLQTQRTQSLTASKNAAKLFETRIVQQKAVIARLEWSVTQARRNLEDTKLKAPFDGFIADPRIELGRLVNTNDQVASVIDSQFLEVRFVVPTQDYGRIVAAEGTVIGRPVAVNWRLGTETLSYQGTIERVGAEIASNSGGVEAFARIEVPAPQASIRAGAFVEIRMDDRPYADVLRVPQSALYPDNRIFVVADGARLASRPVEVVGRDGDAWLVRAEIAAGEPILVTRLPTANDGVKVMMP